MKKNTNTTIGYAVCDKAGKQVSKTFAHYLDAVKALDALVQVIAFTHEDYLYFSSEKHARDYEAIINAHAPEGERYSFTYIGPGFYEVPRVTRRKLCCVAKWQRGANFFNLGGQFWTVAGVDCESARVFKAAPEA